MTATGKYLASNFNTEICMFKKKFLFREDCHGQNLVKRGSFLF